MDNSPLMIQFRSHLFSRIVPIVKDIGLWGPKVRKAFTEMGVHGLADSDIDALMRADEDRRATGQGARRDGCPRTRGGSGHRRRLD